MSRYFNWLALFGILALGGGVGLRLAEDFNISLSREIDSRLQASLLTTLAGNNLNKEEVREARLLFVGDIMLDRVVENRIYVAGDFKHPFLKMGGFLRAADLTFGNLEGPVSTKGENQGSKYSFRADPRVIEGLTYAGFDVLSLANNHIWDWGREALEDTVYLLNVNGIKTVGAGKNETEANRAVIKEVNGNKIAYLAYTNLYPKSLEARGERPGISTFDLEKIRVAIKNLKNQEGVDIVAVSMHFGEEYEPLAGEGKKALARELIDAGVDLVIGHHPHVTQEVEKYKSGWIAYSLGNFVFDQDFSEETMRGSMLEVNMREGKIVTVREIPVKLNSDFQPEMVKMLDVSN